MLSILPFLLRLARAVALAGPVLLVNGCLQPFNPPEISGGAGFLVVEGFLNTGGDTTTIRLSRTQNLTDAEAPPVETRAQVRIEGDRGTIYALQEETPGQYRLAGGPSGDGQQYRLRIRTGRGQEYLSDYVPVKATPPIDSVTWASSGEGVQLYVNTHDPAGNTRYYRWEFSETWEFTTPFLHVYTYRKGEVEYNLENTFRCWANTVSRNILVGTSSRLNEDIIYQYPLQFLPFDSEKHRIRYSILVKQYGLTREGYEYWLNVKRNTENLGTLFDPQPSQVSSNIRPVNNPGEPVLGFFSASSEQEKRIFISPNELPRGWRRITGYESCKAETLMVENYTPTVFANMTFPVIVNVNSGFITTEDYCLDCRFRGVNKQPPFW